MGTDVHGVLQARYGGDAGFWHEVCEMESGRNYRLFAALAGVRNGFGFAGVPTHRPIKPIDEPRGWPEDFNLQSIGHTDSDPWLGDHSFSWLALDEVADWEGWDQPLEQCGFIARDQYQTWDRVSPPVGGWSGGISGHSVIAVDSRQPGWPPDWTHIRVYWTRPLREDCEHFLKWIEYAKAKTKGCEARIVFGFDS